MLGETYSLRIVTALLRENHLEYTYNDAKVGVTLFHHGCRIALNERYTLSIQTHPDIAGFSFAETAMLVDNKVVMDGTFGYDDIKRFHTPEALMEHVRALVDEVRARKK